MAKNPPPATLSSIAAMLGRKGGQAKSEAKTLANRQNAKKKRPRKKKAFNHGRVG